MKISKADFNRFKREFVRLQQLLGLTQYRVSFFHEKLKDNYAELHVQQIDKVVGVYLNNHTNEHSDSVDEGPESHAKHEVIHLLIDRLAWLGQARYIEAHEIEEEAEAIVVRLEKVLK